MCGICLFGAWLELVCLCVGNVKPHSLKKKVSLSNTRSCKVVILFRVIPGIVTCKQRKIPTVCTLLHEAFKSLY